MGIGLFSFQSEDRVCQNDEKQDDQDGGDDENQVCPALGRLIAFLNDIDDRVHLIVPQMRTEEVVAVLSKLDIAAGTADITIICEMLCQKEKRGLILHGTLDIIKSRLAQPVAGHIMVSEFVIDHRTIESGISTFVCIVSDLIKPLVAECKSILIQQRYLILFYTYISAIELRKEIRKKGQDYSCPRLKLIKGRD